MRLKKGFHSHHFTEQRDCSNCFFDTKKSDEEPCFSCEMNPQTGIEDNWMKG